jgi:two-component system nitrate/nitrite sensor histidine kinase NarX
MSYLFDQQKLAEPYRSIFEAAGDGLIIVDRLTGRVIEANPAAGTMHGYTHEELIGMLMTRLVHPESHHVLSEDAEGTLPGGIFEALAVHARKDGSPLHAEVRWTAFTYQDRPCILGIIRDVSARVQAEQALRQRVETHALEQATLLKLSQTLAAGLEFKPGLILDQLRVLIEYTHAGLFVLQDLDLVALAVRGSPRLEQAMPIHIPLDHPDDPGALFNIHQRNRIADVWSADPSAEFVRSYLKNQADFLLEGVRAWMWVPLTVKGHTIGGMSIAHAQADYFTAHDADLAMTIANQAAITMVNAQLYENAQSLAKLQERQRLAQELHDAVNQSLFSAGLIAEVLPRLWEQNPDEGRGALEDLRRLTRGALAEMRGLLAELRPAVLTGTELGDLLRQLSNALTGRTNVPASVTVVGQGSLPPDVQVALYRLCQEALSNVAKHSTASQVKIHLQYAPGTVELIIRDDGCGFDPGHAPAGHSGLSMMRERAEAIGAALSIESEPGHGATITVLWAEAPGVKAL